MKIGFIFIVSITIARLYEEYSMYINFRRLSHKPTTHCRDHIKIKFSFGRYIIVCVCVPTQFRVNGGCVDKSVSNFEFRTLLRTRDIFLFYDIIFTHTRRMK